MYCFVVAYRTVQSILPSRLLTTGQSQLLLLFHQQCFVLKFECALLWKGGSVPGKHCNQTPEMMSGTYWLSTHLLHHEGRLLFLHQAIHAHVVHVRIRTKSSWQSVNCCLHGVVREP